MTKKRSGIELGIPTKIGILGVNVSTEVIIGILAFAGFSMLMFYFFALKRRGQNEPTASPSWT